jgi:hypothetical protein
MRDDNEFVAIEQQLEKACFGWASLEQVHLMTLPRLIDDINISCPL